MTELVLPYDRGIVPQEKYWDCGPASTQVVLNGRGVRVEESVLIDRIGTTVNGTDHVGLIVPVLASYLGPGWVARWMPNDPPSRAQADELWRDITATIDSGYGLVANIVAPPSNYPRGVKGSRSPAYSGGTVYHYIALMGYDDADGRAVWVADSGFAPHGYWVSLDQLASLIPPKGYAARPGLPSPTAAAPPVSRSTGQLLADVTMLTAADSGLRDPRACQAIVIHTNQGPETGSVDSLLAYCLDTSHQASYNLVVGGNGRIGRSNDDNYAPWAAGPTANKRGLHVCALGYAEQSRTEWLDPAALLDALARVIRDWSDRYGIPLEQVTAEDLRAGKRGVCGHVDTAEAWGETDHRDPGPDFPYDLVLARARAIGSPHKEDDMTPEQERMLRDIWEQVRKPWQQLGTNADGQDMTLVDATAEQGSEIDEIRATLRALVAEVAALKAGR